MRRIRENLRYDGATLEQVNAMLADPSFRERVCDAQRVLRRTVSIETDGPGMQVRIDQVQAADGIPGFARKLVGDEINIVQAEQWATADHADVQISIAGKPGDMVGTAVLAEDAQGTTETVELAITVGIPLVGGKLEGLLADLLSKALRAEHRVGTAWLSGSR